MIPKALFTTFISLRITTNPGPSPPSHYQELSPVQPVQVQELAPVALIHNVEPLPAVNQQAMTVDTADYGVSVAEVKYFPFNNIPAGTYDNNKKYDGVQITNGGGARIWSLPDAFPNLKPSHEGNKHAWGPFPQGNNFTVLLDTPSPEIHWSIAWIVSQAPAPGKYTVNAYLGSSLRGSGGGNWPSGWATWRSGNLGAIDRIEVTTTTGASVGVLLLDHLTWQVA